MDNNLLSEIQPPRAVHQVRQFLGLTGYFRHFVKDYALIAKPLTNLLKKSVSWRWAEKEEGSFKKFQDNLVSRPVLGLYSPIAVTEVHTDATTFGVRRGYGPRRGIDMSLNDEVGQIPTLLENLVTAREQAARKIEAAQQNQKRGFDKKRKVPRKYRPGDLVLIEKQHPATGASRKLQNPYSCRLVVKVALPNDRYIVTDMTGSYRAEKRTNYERTVAVDKMKPWCTPGGRRRCFTKTPWEPDDKKAVFEYAAAICMCMTRNNLMKIYRNENCMEKQCNIKDVKVNKRERTFIGDTEENKM
ncbi:unnamed protein product [Callosobruchus maculatus]|uniref:RNA-directed DNA polymerase n=1 Tax=Callosobruchus maculatus TaxID=64391 RepID=A0A653DDL7_CALMS|nr:unnamed protein product [Callosobruchus maculatus]